MHVWPVYSAGSVGAVAIQKHMYILGAGEGQPTAYEYWGILWTYCVVRACLSWSCV